MKYFQEATDWDAGYKVPNHIYYMSDDKRKAVGYIKENTTTLIKFSQPMSIDPRGRKFVALDMVVDSDEVYFPKEKQTDIAKVVTVQGSNGKQYFVSKVGNRISCTCPGFTFRNTCKHIKEYK